MIKKFFWIFLICLIAMMALVLTYAFVHRAEPTKKGILKISCQQGCNWSPQRGQAKAYLVLGESQQLEGYYETAAGKQVVVEDFSGAPVWQSSDIFSVYVTKEGWIRGDKVGKYTISVHHKGNKAYFEIEVVTAQLQSLQLHNSPTLGVTVAAPLNHILIWDQDSGKHQIQVLGVYEMVDKGEKKIIYQKLNHYPMYIKIQPDEPQLRIDSEGLVYPPDSPVTAKTTWEIKLKGGPGQAYEVQGKMIVMSKPGGKLPQVIKL